MIDIRFDSTIRSVVDRFPETRDVFVANGFPHFKNDRKLDAVGRYLTLGSALDHKGIDRETFLKLLIEQIQRTRETVDVTLKNTQQDAADIEIQGLLPCPVRIPILEALDRKVTALSGDGSTVSYRLEAASGGVDWIREELMDAVSEQDIPDVFLSAGFDLFFEEDTFGRFRDKGIFKDPCPTGMNPCFTDMDLTDPTGEYMTIGVVPAVFLVNIQELDGRAVPRTWSDLLSAEFENSVSLPVGDFDLFNALLLTIRERFGTAGVEKLARSMCVSQHPSQVVRKSRNTSVAVTVIPFFFTRMAGQLTTMEVVWPEDGAIISPIFLLARCGKPEVDDLVRFFKSREMGDILALKGLFPSTHPEVKNPIPDGARFSWIGWDRLRSGHISEWIRESNHLFQENTGVIV